MSWVEFINSPDIERNDDGFMHAVRSFKVWNYSRSVIANHPANVLNSSSQPLLDSNELRLNYLSLPDPYTQADDVVLVAYDIRVTPRSLINEVEVRYTNDIRLLSKPLGQDQLGRAPKGKAGAFSTAFETIPIMRWVPLQIDAISGNAVRSGWEEQQWPVPTQKNRVSYSMLLNEASLLVYRQTVQQHVGKIVQFNTPGPAGQGLDDFFLFEGMDYAHHSPGLLMVTLFFQHDPGILDIDMDSTATRRVPPQDKTWFARPGVNYIRPPYQQLQMLRDNQGAPVWQTIEWHQFSPSGAIALLMAPERP